MPHEPTVTVVRHELRDAAEIGPDYRGSRGERLENGERPGLEPLRRDDSRVVRCKRLDDTVGCDRRMESDARIGPAQRKELIAVTRPISQVLP